MRLSPFNSIHLQPKGTAPLCRGQIFAPSDHIMLQVIKGKDEGIEPLSVFDGEGNFILELDWITSPINETTTLAYYELTGLEAGQYRLEWNGLESAIFEITDDEDELEDTVLLQYASSDNKERIDLYTKIGNGIHYFDFRVPGGFLDKDWSFGVDCLSFPTDRSDIVELHSHEWTAKTLTIGNCEGVPVWVAEKVNAIFSLDLTFVDGRRMAREETSAVEMLTDNEERNVYALTLRDAVVIDVEFEEYIRLYLRRTPTALRLASDTNLRAYKK